MAAFQARPRRRTAPMDGAVPLTRLGRSGPEACGEVELLAIATGRRLSAAALLLERIGGMQGLSSATTHELIRAGLAPGRAAALTAAWEIGRRGAAALPDGRWI